MLISARMSPAFTTNSRRNSVEAKFVSGAQIHFACQSAFCRTPIVQVAGWLHAEGIPFASHTRTFQKTGCDDFNFSPGNGIWIVSSEVTLPLSHKSPVPRARFFSVDAARIS